MATPMQKISVIVGPLVRFLAVSTEFSMRMLGVIQIKQVTVTDEDVKVLMQEGLRSGAFNQVESQIVTSALELDQLPVREIMTPRVKMIGLHSDESHKSAWRKIVTSSHSFFPCLREAGTRSQVLSQ